MAKRAKTTNTNATIQVTSMELVIKPFSRNNGSAVCEMPCSAGAGAVRISRVSTAALALPACSRRWAASKRAGAAKRISAARMGFMNGIRSERCVSGTPVPLLRSTLSAKARAKLPHREKFHKRFLAAHVAGSASRYCPRTADGPRPQHVGPLRRTAESQSFCTWPCAANRDGSRSGGHSAEMRPVAARGGFKQVSRP